MQLALAGSTLGYWGLAIALAVWAYEEGGATLAGVALFVRLFPTAVFSPLAGLLADRYPRRRVMLVCDLGRAPGERSSGPRLRLTSPPRGHPSV